MNIIENVWGALVRALYKDGRQFENMEDLQDSIAPAWSQIGLHTVHKKFVEIYLSPSSNCDCKRMGGYKVLGSFPVELFLIALNFLIVL